MELIGLAAQQAGDPIAHTGFFRQLCHFRIPDKAKGRGHIHTDHLPEQIRAVTGSAAAGIIGAFMDQGRLLLCLQGQRHCLLGVIDGNGKVFPAIPGMAGSRQGTAVSRFLGLGSGNKADAARGHIAIGETLEKAQLQKIRVVLLHPDAKILYIGGGARSFGHALSRHHKPGQLYQAVVSLVAQADLLFHQCQDPASLVILVDMGIALAADKNIGKISHFIGNIAVQVQHQADGDLMAKFGTDHLEHFALDIRVLWGSASAMHEQNNAIIRLLFVGFPQFPQNLGQTFFRRILIARTGRA